MGSNSSGLPESRKAQAAAQAHVQEGHAVHENDPFKTFGLALKKTDTKRLIGSRGFKLHPRRYPQSH
jgi:hypothetical protein